MEDGEMERWRQTDGDRQSEMEDEEMKDGEMERWRQTDGNRQT